MANDVFNDAVRPPPDPGPDDINSNDSKNDEEDKDMKIVDEQAQNDKNLTTKNFYTNTSTKTYEAAASNNINNQTMQSNCTGSTIKPSESVVNDYKLSPYSNDTSHRVMNPPTDATLHRYSSTTTTTTSTSEPPPTPSTPNTSNTTTVAYYHTPDDMDISMEVPQQVPAITPFVLGKDYKPLSPHRRLIRKDGPLDMRSLQSATHTASNQVNLPTLPTEEAEDNSPTSLSPMETADVSTAIPKLMPKKTANPYSKPTLAKTNIKSNLQTRTNRHDTSPLPTTGIEISTNPNTASTNQSTEFQELSQEELQLVQKAIEEEEQQQNAWTEVPKKSSRVTFTPDRPVKKSIVNNPFNPLQSDDEDTDDTNTKAPPTNYNHQTTLNSTTNKNQTNDEFAKASETESPKASTSQQRPTTKKQPAFDQKKQAGRGGGKIVRDSQANLTNSLTALATTKQTPPTNTPTNNNVNMELDDPDPTPKPPPQPPTPPPNSSSLRRAVNQPLKYTYQIYIRAFPNGKDSDDYTRLNIINIVLSALQAG
jgi:hypothetical protein